MADLSSRLAGLNPFASAGPDSDSDSDSDAGEPAAATAADAAAAADQPAPSPRVSPAMRHFLVEQGVVAAAEAGVDADEPGAGVRALLRQPAFAAPAHLVDDGHPLPAYFVSASHNTYLAAHQLYGAALAAGFRCIEVDAWDNADDAAEPRVTHGYTLVAPVAFRAVCEAVRAALDAEPQPAPVLLVSLENHCAAPGQRRLVAIMRDVFGARLLAAPVREGAGGEHVTLAELAGRVAVMVEHHGEADAGDGAEAAEGEAEQAPEPPVIPELAQLGVYAQSVKPRDDSWLDDAWLDGGAPDGDAPAGRPHHPLVNLSETALGRVLPTRAAAVARHNARHLMRVYPRGSRIASSNLAPLPFWGVGAHVCALNGQTFGSSNQLNDALFRGSRGFVLKPPELRAGRLPAPPPRRGRLRVHAAGASGVPVPAGREAPPRAYLTCTLHTAATAAAKRKTAAFHHHRLGVVHRGPVCNPAPTDPAWHAALAWDFDDDGLAFVRLRVKSDDAWARNPLLAVAAVRLAYAPPGWAFVRMRDPRGRPTACTLLVRFDVEDVE